MFDFEPNGPRGARGLANEAVLDRAVKKPGVQSSLRRFGPSVLALSGFVILLVSIAALDFRQAILLRHERHWVRHNISMIQTLQDIGSTVRDAETGQRGYLLTGKSEYLAPYDGALLRLPALRTALGRLIADEPQQRQLERQLDSLVDAKFAELAQTIRLRQTLGEAAARAVVLDDVGRHLMVKIVATLNQMLAEERSLVKQRRLDADHIQLVNELLSFGGILTGVATLCFAGLILRRFVTRLRESEETFRLLAEHADDIVSRANSDGELRYVSPSLERIFGLSPADMVGATMLPFVHPDDQEKEKQSIARMLDGSIAQDAVTLRICREDGREIWLETNRRLLRDPTTGGVDGFVSVSRDITQRRSHEAELEVKARDLEASNRQLERLSRHLAKARDLADQATQAKSQFLASMSHELRTPLNAIIGYAQLLRLEGQFESLQSSRVDAMLGAGLHLLEMINRVLDLSEIEAAGVELQVAEVDPRDVAEACVEVVRGAAVLRGLTLQTEGDADVPARVALDPMRLRQILLNLLGNAVKFTQRGGVALHLRIAANSMLRFEVIDTGPGIPADARHLLFQDFKRVGASVVPVEGSGLGLAISVRLAVLMGGRIDHEDRLGGGSVFALELPMTPLPVTPSPVRSPSKIRPTRALRILVVDDVPMNRDIASSFLVAAGHAVTCVEGGSEAIEAAAVADYDVILMDVRMPGMDGLEAARRIRELPAPRGLVRIIALTAQTFTKQIEECHQAGMDDHLAKPFAQDALLEAVARVREDVASGAVERTGVPICNREAFEQVTSLLPSSAVISYIDILIERCEELRRALREPAAAREIDIVEAAHMLVGSAGMLGFQRLAYSARHFEQVTTGMLPGRAAPAEDLADVLEVSLSEMQRLKPVIDSVTVSSANRG